MRFGYRTPDASQASALARQASEAAAAVGGAVPEEPAGGLIESGAWTPRLWTQTRGSMKPANVTPHGKDVSQGTVALGPNEGIWSARLISRPTGTGPIDVVVKGSISGLAAGATVTIEAVDDRFNAFGAATSNVAEGFTGVPNGDFFAVIRLSNGDLGGYRKHRIGVRLAATSPAGAVLTLESVAYCEVAVPNYYSIYDYNPSLVAGADISDAIDRAYRMMPIGTDAAPSMIDFGGVTWSIGRPSRNKLNYQGWANGGLRALGTLADWTTTEQSPDDEVRALKREYHDEPGSGWTDPTTIQRAMIEAYGYRPRIQNMTLDCKEICSGIDDSRSGSQRFSDITVNNFGVVGWTYIGNSGGQFVNIQTYKFGSAGATDPRIGSNRLNSGFGCVIATVDGGMRNCGGFGGSRVILQLKGGTFSITGGHTWNSSGGMLHRITSPRAAGEVYRIPNFMSDTPLDTSYNTNLMTAEIGADGYMVVTFKADWNPVSGTETIVYCRPRDRVCAEMRGGNSIWTDHYHDDGIYWFYGTKHAVKGRVSLVNAMRVNIDAMWQFSPTAVGQSLSDIYLDVDPPVTDRFAKIVAHPKVPSYSFAANADRALLRPGATFSPYGIRHWSRDSLVGLFLTGQATGYVEIGVSGTPNTTLIGNKGGLVCLWLNEATDANLMASFSKSSGHHRYRIGGAGDSVDVLHGASGYAAFTRWITTVLGVEKSVSAGGKNGSFIVETAGAERLEIDDAGNARLTLPNFSDEAAVATAVAANTLTSGMLYTINREVRKYREGIPYVSGNKLAMPNAGLYLSGRYYDNQTGSGTASTTLTGVAGHVLLSPFMVPAPVKIDRLGVAIATAVADAKGKCFIYGGGDVGFPSALLWAATDDLDLSTTGYKAHTLDFTFQPGVIYWLGIRHSSTAQLRAITIAAALNLGLVDGDSTAQITMIRRTLDYGTALPATWGFTASDLVNNVGPPSVRFRVA